MRKSEAIDMVNIAALEEAAKALLSSKAEMQDPDPLSLAVARGKAAAAQWQALSQKTFTKGIDFALDAAAASARVACANLLAIAASACVTNLDVDTLAAPQDASEREKKAALDRATEQQRAAYAAWTAVAAMGPDTVLFGENISDARTSAAKSFNRLPCRESARAGKDTPDARMRASMHRRMSENAHVLCPKPVFSSKLTGYLFEKICIEHSSGSYSSYRCIEYRSKDTPEAEYGTPVAGIRYAYLRRWSPINLAFETIILLNANGSGLHFTMVGHAEYIVAAGEVAFDIRYLHDGRSIISVKEFDLRSSSYHPKPEIRFCTGFPEEAYHLFQGNSAVTAAAGSGAGASAADAAAGSIKQYAVDDARPETPSQRSSSRNGSGSDEGMSGLASGRRKSFGELFTRSTLFIGAGAGAAAVARSVPRQTTSLGSLTTVASESRSSSADSSPRLDSIADADEECFNVSARL